MNHVLCSKKCDFALLEILVAGSEPTISRGIGMSPDKAIIIENNNLVLENQLKYEKEFIKASYKKSNDIFNSNEEVLIKNEIKNSKMDKEFLEKRKVINLIGSSCYQI
ncbi:hypothetical protein DMUE_0145 [Dictyocoela muelleri]|nr:hypothetical protein DMUE_0145 [Dictyocoela muelleri]